MTTKREGDDSTGGGAGAAAPGADERVRGERYRVRSYEVDPRGQLHIATIFNYLQETAAIDVLARGFSNTDLLARRQVWVLSRLALEIERRPGWRDEVVVHTWAAGTKGRLLALRDFQLEDAAGAGLARCCSGWLYIDVASRRPQRVDRGLIDDFPVRAERALDHPLDKLPPLAAAGEESRFAVRYRDVDVNQHVNNARYVEYVMASLPAAVLKEQTLAALELSFLAEARLGDGILVRCLPTGAGVFQHSVLREHDGLELVRAQTRWR